MKEIVFDEKKENPFPEGHKLNGNKDWASQYSFPVHFANEEASQAWGDTPHVGVRKEVLEGLNSFEEWVKGYGENSSSKKLLLESVSYYRTQEESLLLLDSVETVGGVSGRTLSGKRYLTIMQRKGEEKSSNLSVEVIVMNEETKGLSRIISFPKGISSDEDCYNMSYIPKGSGTSKVPENLIKDLDKLGYNIPVLEEEKIPS